MEVSLRLRLLWGTDWPFVRMGDKTPEAGRLVRLSTDWTVDPALRHQVLVQPRPALRFPPPPGEPG